MSKQSKYHSKGNEHYNSWKQTFAHAAGATAVLFGLMFLLTLLPHINASFFGPLENAIEDIRFSDLFLTNNTKQQYLDAVDNILLVNLVDSRAEIADLIDTIVQYQPKVIALDVIFNKREDSANYHLQQSICSNNELIVLARKVHTQGNIEQNTDEPIDSVSFFISSPGCDKLATGYVNVEGESKARTIRYFIPTMTDSKTNYTNSFAVEAVNKTGKQLNIISIPTTDLNHQTFINYRPNVNDRFQIVNQKRLMTDPLLKSSLKNKILILGHVLPARPENSHDLDDLHYTPLNKDFIGRSNPDMYGPQIQAFIIAMLLTADYVKTVPTSWQHFFSFFTALFAMILIIRIGRFNHALLHAGALGLRIILGLLSLSIAYLLFRYSNLNLEVAYMLSCLVLCIEALAIWEALFQLYLFLKKPR